MKSDVTLSDTWLKASILGATWAASEIILGSFLHNLRIPFKGNILTTIAFILLIAVSYKWNDRGLFWRSGLVCALMKTMSPSAVIFGPMVAIFMESLLLDLSVRLLGRNVLGFLLGSVIAMSWILAQKIFNYILFYGHGLIDIYSQLMIFIEKQLQFQFNLVWAPIVILLGINLLFGLIAVALGMYAGRNLINESNTLEKAQGFKQHDLPVQKPGHFPYSVPWLIVNIAVLLGMLFILNRSPLWLWAPTTIIVISVWSHRYGRALRQLSKPKFWVFFVGITMVSAFIITAIQNNGDNWVQGLLAGLQMNFRAAIVISGFTVLGTELYNPIIRQFFSRSTFKQLPVALNLAFETLPYVIGKLPDVKSILKYPVTVIRLLVNHAEDRFKELKSIQKKPVFLITGDKSEGKTRFTKELIESLQSGKISVGGVLSCKITINGTTSGYDLIDIATGERMQFLKINGELTSHKVGRFEINSQTLLQGKQILHPSKLSMHDVVVIDETGKLEVQGKGWADSIEGILKANSHPLVITVRTDFINAVIEKFGLENPLIHRVSDSNSHQVANNIIEACIEMKRLPE